MQRIKNQRIIFLTALSLLTVIIYLPGLYGSFLNWDDNEYVVENFLLRDMNWANIKAIFTDYFHGHYHPLTLISLMIDFRIGGLDPRTYHLTNLIIHLLNTVLVFLLIRKLTKKDLIAVIAATLFAIHPMNVESVTWITERKNLLMGFFFLVSLLQYLKYIDSFKSRHFYLSFFWFMIAVLSKGVAIVLPLVLFGIDYLYKRNLLERKVFFEKIPFLIVAALFGLVAINANVGNSISFGYYPDVMERIIYSNYAFAFYIYKLIFPFNLSALYPYPHTIYSELPWFYYAFLPALLLFITFIIILVRKNQRLLVFGLSFFLINIILLLKFHDVPSGDYIIADRYVYLAGIGLFLSIGVLLERITGAFKTSKIPLIIVLLVITVGLGFLSNRRVVVWSDSFLLWDDVLSKYPYVTTALNNRGSIKVEAGDFEGGMDDLLQAIKYDSLSFRSYMNIGLIHSQKENYEQAIIEFDNSLEINPLNPEAYWHRGFAKFKILDYKSAINDYTAAIYYNPDNNNYYFFRGNAFADYGDLESAVEDYTKTIELNQYHAKAWFIRGMAYIELGEREKGCENLERSLSLGYEWAAVKIKENCSDK